MYYKIVKTIGKVSAILSEDIPQQGICLEFKSNGNGGRSILIYQNGELNDLCLNGWTFPYIFNNVSSHSWGNDIWGGFWNYIISFELLDPSGAERRIVEKRLYGDNDLQAIVYFFTLLYNISCCENFEQYKDLYKYVYDMKWKTINDENFPIEVISFINKFTPHLKNLSDDYYLSELKRTIDTRRKEAADRIKAQGGPK